MTGEKENHLFHKISVNFSFPVGTNTINVHNFFASICDWQIDNSGSMKWCDG